MAHLLSTLKIHLSGNAGNAWPHNALQYPGVKSINNHTLDYKAMLSLG